MLNFGDSLAPTQAPTLYPFQAEVVDKVAAKIAGGQRRVRHRGPVRQRQDRHGLRHRR